MNYNQHKRGFICGLNVSEEDQAIQRPKSYGKLVLYNETQKYYPLM